MDFEFEGEVIYWRGPSPWFFVVIPPEYSAEIRAVAHAVTYGWGVIPARVQIGQTGWTTSLFPKDGLYLVPLRTDIRKAEQLDEGEVVRVWLSLGR